MHIANGLENLRAVARQAGPYDHHRAEAAFPRYNHYVTQIAGRYGFSTSVGAAVFSALSPNNSYHGNLRDTDVLLRAAGTGQAIESFKVHTYGPNKRKAWAIAQGADPLKLIVADKTRSFYLNILDPTNPVPVTIDGHMYCAWIGQRFKLVSLRFKDVAGLYQKVAEDVRTLAAECGYIPCVAQALVWHTWRRMHWIKTTPQLEFWDPEHLAANLGWARATNH